MRDQLGCTYPDSDSKTSPWDPKKFPFGFFAILVNFWGVQNFTANHSSASVKCGRLNWVVTSRVCWSKNHTTNGQDRKATETFVQFSCLTFIELLFHQITIVEKKTKKHSHPILLARTFFLQISAPHELTQEFSQLNSNFDSIASSESAGVSPNGNRKHF